MTSSDFIKQKIKELTEKYPSIKCIYEKVDDEFDTTHYIKIIPIYIYDNFLKNEETEIIKQFIDKFPDEGICFISRNDLIDIENPMFEREGVFYPLTKQLTFNNHVVNFHENIHLENIQSLNFHENKDYVFANANHNLTKAA